MPKDFAGAVAANVELVVLHVTRRIDEGAAIHADDLALSMQEPRQVATDDRYLTQLETENVFLKSQITSKDTQIAALLERDHETNALINGLQRMLAPLLSAPDAARREDPPRQADEPRRG